MQVTQQREDVVSLREQLPTHPLLLQDFLSEGVAGAHQFSLHIFLLWSWKVTIVLP